MSANAIRAPQKGEVYAALAALAAELPFEDLPELLAELARAQGITTLRFSADRARAAEMPAALLTVEAVAKLLGISEQNVYARAKADLRSSAVDVGPGQLRFDPAQIERFIRSRRRGTACALHLRCTEAF